MDNDSSPGPDGLGAAFYKCFWSKISPLVLNSLNEAFTTAGQLSISQRKAFITLIHKGKDLSRDNISHYRPISLTNCDYKLGAKILAARLQKVVTKVVSPEQSAYIKGRSISNNLRLIDDIICYTKETNSQGMIVALDFAKAFDSVSKPLIVQMLQKFNFGSNFIDWVQIYKNNTRSCIMYNGWQTEYFATERGIRQGSALRHFFSSYQSKSYP